MSLLMAFGRCCDIKQSDGKASVMLKLRGMQCTPLLLSLQGPPWLGVIALDRILAMSQMELFDI